MTFYRLGDVDMAIRHAEAALQMAAELGSGGGDDEFTTALQTNLAVLKRMQQQSGKK